MAIYSINDLEQLSGIKAHTLRIWEQRYGVVEPHRTATNIRYYTDSQLRRLLNISMLNKHGYKISKIAKMPEADMAVLIDDIAHKTPSAETYIDTLALAMVEMDEIRFEEVVGGNIQAYGFESTMETLIFPFLEKIHLLYLTGSIKPAQEHFMTNLIRQKIIAAIDAVPLSKCLNSPKFLIFLPEGDKQELIIAYLHYILKSKGFFVLNLGINLGAEDVKVV